MSRATRALLIPLFALACDSGGSNVAPGTTECPPCECKCECGDDDGGQPVVAEGDGGGGSDPVVPATSDIGELVASASREMMHDDGQGCLNDLNKIRKLDPKYDRRLAVTRGQCEMLVGRCKEGKARIAAWYQSEMAMSKERAETMAEQLGSMRCREGNSTNRDQLLRALYELSDGAYMNKKTPKWCGERVATIKQLLPKVPTSDPDDQQITGGAQALFYTAATCYSKAGDCKGAFKVYRENFPAKGLAAIKDKAQREKIVRESFDSSITRCK